MQLNRVRLIKETPGFLRRSLSPTELQRNARHVKHAVRGWQVQWATLPEAKPDLDGAGSDASTRDEMFVVRMSRRSAHTGALNRRGGPR
jgi:hypothetical protein